jgi:protein-tyrosine phosphatase
MTFADRQNFCLLELPFDTLPDIRPILDDLSQAGIRGVIAHPERNAVIARDPDLVLQWLEYELTFQITATSVLADPARRVAEAAWRLLKMPIRCILASDAHGALKRPPQLGEAYATLVDREGLNRARELCVYEPMRILGRERHAEVRPFSRKP